MTSYMIGLPLVVLLLCVTSTVASFCSPGENCKLPTCRCWDDPTPPGGIAPTQTPQIVVVTIPYAVNSANVDKYTALFDGIKNPNSCPATGTFFVQKLYSSADSVKTLYDKKHEIAVTSSDGTLPKDWSSSFNDVRHFLISAGLSYKDITGARAPQLEAGGDSEMAALTSNSLRYDASCITKEHMSATGMLWPYTYDFVSNTPNCSIGKTPSASHPGVWELLTPELEFQGHVCASPSACSPYMNNSNSDDSFNFFQDNFLKHYNTKRTPFTIEINPQWVAVQAQVQGTKRFLQFIRAAYTDTWIITNSQLLAWILKPVPSAEAVTFKPWGC